MIIILCTNLADMSGSRLNLGTLRSHEQRLDASLASFPLPAAVLCFGISFIKSSTYLQTSRAVSQESVMGSKTEPHLLYESNFKISWSQQFRVPCVIINITIMRFLSFVLPVTILFPTAISQDLFLDDNSLDMLPLQDPSQDLLASQDLPETSDSITDANDDDFFTDSDTMDSFSAESPDFFSDLTASCSTGNEQSLNKLRSRDEEVCPPKSPALSQRKPPTGDLDEAVRKWREFILGVPVDTSDDLSCRPDYPHHLCCFTVSDPVGDRTLPGFFYYETVSGCYRGPHSLFFCLNFFWSSISLINE